MLDPEVRAILDGKAGGFAELDEVTLAAILEVGQRNLSPADSLLKELVGKVE